MSPYKSHVVVSSPNLLHKWLVTKICQNISNPSFVSSFGFRYFVTFIYEHLVCTWVYLMRDHYELMKISKIIGSENAKEYFSFDLSLFQSSQDILHQSTYPNTPQQNGIVERKNRHLVEIAQTLLLHANVLVWINYLLEPLNMFFVDTFIFKKGIVSINLSIKKSKTILKTPINQSHLNLHSSYISACKSCPIPSITPTTNPSDKNSNCPFAL
ncbi:hypothetical protein CR513_32528, partial [Mucuna pruriens]